MFYYLRHLAREYGNRFRELLGNGPTADIRGVQLRFDPYWIEALLHGRHGPFWRAPYNGFLDWDFFLDPKFMHQWRPSHWKRHCALRGYPDDANPVQWAVVFREEWMLREYGEKLPRVFDAPGGPMPIRYEARPPAVALSAPGDSIGQLAPFTDGTLGGFLEDRYSAKPYLVTCAHVTQTGQTVYSPPMPASPVIGRVVHAVLPPPRAGTGCNRVSHPTPVALDLAVAELTTGHAPTHAIPSLGQPKAVTPLSMMASNDRVSFYGRTSKRVQAELGSLCLYHEIDIAGVPHCFGDLFSLTHPRPWYLNTDLAKKGDSGAWVVRRIGSLVSWDGMLIAGDGATAYGCFADNIMAECGTALPNLILP